MAASKGRDFILQARHFNEGLEDQVVEWVKRNQSVSDPAPICVSGLAFKGVPATSDLRGSTAVNIVKKLKTLGYSIRLHDFVAKFHELAELDLGEVCKDLSQGVKSSKLLLILNNHSSYRHLEIDSLVPLMAAEPKVFDSWNTLETLGEEIEGVTIVTLGNHRLS